MAQTVGQIAQGVLDRLSIVPGLSQQTYAQPRIIRAIEDAIAFVMEETQWASYIQPVTVPVVNGMLTTDLVGARGVYIDELVDIVAVFDNTGRRKLPQWNNFENPNNAGGAGRVFITPSNLVLHRPFTVLPNTYTDDVTVITYAKPLIPIGVNDVIYLDPTMLSLGATYMIAAGDSISSGDTSRLQAMFTERIKQMVKSNEAQGFALDAATDGGTNVWWSPP